MPTTNKSVTFVASQERKDLIVRTIKTDRSLGTIVRRRSLDTASYVVCAGWLNDTVLVVSQG
ncbi:MAG TPA: hypothetical protein VF719_07575, partial [Abditibacteriaceae bacterium]